MPDSSKRILLVSPSISDHLTDKIEKGLKSGRNVAEVLVAGVSRKELPVSENRTLLGSAVSASYFSRLALYPKMFFKIRKMLKNCGAVYSWSVDTAFVSLLAAKSLRGKKFIYGYSDVHPVATRKKGIIPKLVRFVEKTIAKNSDMVVFTSPLFRTEYFGKMLGLEIEKYAVIENKIHREYADFILENYNPKPVPERDFVFGYFGVLTYMDAFSFIKQAAKSGIKTLVRGLIGREGREAELVGGVPNLEYAGKYKNPEDIPSMFSQIDVSWMIHSFAPETNFQWQMTNRFYEALMMGVPVVVQKGTAHEDFVLHNDIGLSIDIYSPEESIGLLKKITAQDLKRWRQNLKNLDKSRYLLGDGEYADMLDKVWRDSSCGV